MAVGSSSREGDLGCLAAAVGYAFRKSKRMLPAGLRRDTVIEHLLVALELVSEIAVQQPPPFVKCGGLPLLCRLAAASSDVHDQQLILHEMPPARSDTVRLVQEAEIVLEDGPSPESETRLPDFSMLEVTEMVDDDLDELFLQAQEAGPLGDLPRARWSELCDESRGLDGLQRLHSEMEAEGGIPPLRHRRLQSQLRTALIMNLHGDDWAAELRKIERKLSAAGDGAAPVGLVSSRRAGTEGTTR